jgi:hypothetical protein
MHFNFDFSARQFLWTFTFASQLILLVVLLGRERIRRFPWFTAAIVLFALRLMAEVLLSGRMPPLILQETFLVLGALTAIVGLLVLVELARRAFAGARRSLWIANAVGVLIVAVAALVLWGPWPAAKDLALDTLRGKLLLIQLAAQKGDMLVQLLTIEVGLLVVLFGRRFKAGWRTHPQMIAIGLSTIAAAWLAIIVSWQIVMRTAHPHSQVEYNRIVDLGGKLMNANKVVYLAAVIWWIMWLWLDEPGTAKTPPAEAVPELAESSPAESTPAEPAHPESDLAESAPTKSAPSKPESLEPEPKQ